MIGGGGVVFDDNAYGNAPARDEQALLTAKVGEMAYIHLPRVRG